MRARNWPPKSHGLKSGDCSRNHSLKRPAPAPGVAAYGLLDGIAGTAAAAGREGDGWYWAEAVMGTANAAAVMMRRVVLFFTIFCDNGCVRAQSFRLFVCLLIDTMEDQTRHKANA